MDGKHELEATTLRHFLYLFIFTSAFKYVLICPFFINKIPLLFIISYCICKILIILNLICLPQEKHF
nr:hypothetical protein [uncultured bacterium]